MNARIVLAALGAVAILGGVMAGVGLGRGTPPPAVLARRPRHVILLVDVSKTISEAQLRLFFSLAREVTASLDHGDEIRIVAVHRAGAIDGSFDFRAVVAPLRHADFASSRDRQNRDADRTTASDQLDLLAAGERPARTDLLGTLFALGADVRDAAERPTAIVLLSDMEQSDGVIEMHGAARMPARGWLEQQEKKGLIPDLSGVCIAVVGADASKAGGQKVRAFWEEFFRRAKADLRAYVPTATSVAQVGCS